MAYQKTTGKHDYRVLAGFGIVLVLIWGLFALLPLIALRSTYFTLNTEKDVERVRSTLSQLGTYGDMFGALNCLFSGTALIGVVYAVILQRRELHHQQEEMERSRLDREESDKAREQESKDNAAWLRRTAMLNAITFLAQAHATKLSAFPAEIISHADRERLEGMRAQREATIEDLEKYTGMLTRFLEVLAAEHEQDLRTVEAYRTGRADAFDDLWKPGDSILASDGSP